MLPTTVTTTGTSPAVGSAIINASQGGLFLWCATARDRISSTGDPVASSVRETTTCYMRGLKEVIGLTTNNDQQWRWRRICFTTKSLLLRFTGIAGATPVALEASPQGWVRLLNNQNTVPLVRNTITTEVFDGANGIDWLSYMVAKTDNQRITVLYDRIKMIRSGNGTGVNRTFNMWHPMNKNLVYNNDESGERDTDEVFSSTALAGMGDYYVLDLFDCPANGSASNELRFDPQATLYWHEK